MPLRFSMRLPVAAFALASAAIVLTLFSGFLLYQRMINESEKEHREKYLLAASLLAESARLMEGHAPASAFPELLVNLWRQAGDHAQDEYICIVDHQGRLVLHTARPETVGNYCGDNPIFPVDAGRPDRLLRLLEEQSSYAGEYIASSGQKQVAAFVPIPGRQWLLGLHRAKNELHAEIEHNLRPLRYGFLFVGGVLMPLAVFLIFLLFHRNNRQLRDSSEALRSFYMTADDVAIITVALAETDQTIIEFNPGAEHLFGFDRQESVGRPLSMLYAPDAAGQLPDIQAEMLRSGKGRRHEAILLKKDGRTFPGLFTMHPRRDAEARLIGAWVVVIDISDQKEIENRLRLNEEHFSRLLTLTQLHESSEHELTRYALEEAVALTRSETGYFHYFDEDTRLIKLTAWSENVLRQCRTESATHYPLPAAGIWADCIRLGKPVIHNDYQACPDNKGLPEGHFPLQRHMSVPVFEHGKIVAVCGVGNKTRPYSEEDSQHLALFMNTFIQILKERQVAAELRSVRKTLDATLDAIYIFDPKTLRFIYVNRGAIEQIGYSREELLQMTPLDIKPQMHANTFREILASLVNGERERTFFETEHRHKNGRSLPVEIALQYVREPAGQFVAVVRDISQRKKMEEALLYARKMEAIGTLAGGIAHDFNNILAAIMGYAELTKAAIEKDEHLAGDLQEILAAGRRAKDLVHRLLIFTQQREERREPVKLQRVVAEAIQLLRPTLPANIELRREIDPACLPVRANTEQVIQIIINLCTNAVHAMRRRMDARLTITLAQASLSEKQEYCAACGKDIAAGNHVKLEVSDNGEGLDAETRRRLFDPFFTTKKFGEGAGLGLSVVHGIVKAHGAHLTIQSAPDEGLRFSIFFPPAPDAEPPASERSQGEEMPRGRNERILLVDDEVKLAAVLDKLLSGLGYRVHAFTDSNDAWEEFQGAPDNFDLVLTDMAMPGMNGVELALRIFSLRPGMPVILTTGYTTAINETGARQLGLQAMLYKPVSKAVLAKAVRAALAAGVTS